MSVKFKRGVPGCQLVTDGNGLRLGSVVKKPWGWVVLTVHNFVIMNVAKEIHGEYSPTDLRHSNMADAKARAKAFYTPIAEALAPRVRVAYHKGEAYPTVDGY